MDLADFILENKEAILVEWEKFARSLTAGAEMGKVALRDHAGEILHATAEDMKSSQSAVQQTEKSKGEGETSRESEKVDQASELHGSERVTSGFQLEELVAEYRALRASVLRLWHEKNPAPDPGEREDTMRFNESIDQSLSIAVQSYTERVDRSQQMFLAVLGHDLRNPLSAVRLGTALLSKKGMDNQNSAVIVSQIVSSVSAMDRMIEDLLHFTGSVLGAAPTLSKTKTNLKRLCREVVDEIQAANLAHVIRFDSHGDFYGEWDSGRLRRAISNLLGNAVQHGAKRSPIDLTLNQEGSDVLISVRNEGHPIPPEEIATIFDPLIRGASPEAQKKRRLGSIGLGLYIVKDVIISHGGTIAVTSSSEGGTIFSIRLPVNHSA